MIAWVGFSTTDDSDGKLNARKTDFTNNTFRVENPGCYNTCKVGSDSAPCQTGGSGISYDKIGVVNKNECASLSTDNLTFSVVNVDVMSDDNKTKLTEAGLDCLGDYAFVTDKICVATKK